MADELDDPAGDTALRHIDDLIELSEKARELDRIVAAEFDREPTELVSSVGGIVEAVADEYASASISVDADREITADVMPSLERALTELIENAAKHGGETPTVSVSVEPVPNAVEIRIADDGPGLADHEADVLRTGTETPLIHGSGLGLWLAHWIVTGHDGSVGATVTPEGTTMTVTVLRRPATRARKRPARLARTRGQYQAAFEKAYDAMLIVNDEARIVDANSAASDVYGADSRALLGRPVPEFLPEGFDFETAWREFHNVGAERDTVTVVGADGVERPAEYAATTDVVPGHHFVVSRDATD